ncbi:MAG: hypothetical protein IJI24_06690 [Lachnospiraceae bacterium]|nr:hypothetical protein [Lachnospiraceae bacterium]
MNSIRKKILIKILMLFAMTGNHIAILFGNLKEPHWRLLLGVGYSVAFVMCYYLAEGYTYTSSRRRYGLRLAGFAVLSQYPYYAAFRDSPVTSWWSLSMMFTLLVSFLLLEARTYFRGQAYLRALCAALILLTSVSDWPLLGPIMTLLFARGREEGEPLRYYRHCFAIFAMTVLLSNASEFTSPFPFILFSCIDMTGPLLAWGLLRWYETGIISAHIENEQKDSDNKQQLPAAGSENDPRQKASIYPTAVLGKWKWIFYLYYPAHLMLLAWLQRS